MVKVIVLRAGRRWPCTPRVKKEVEACPPRRNGGGCSASGAVEQSGAVRFAADRLKPAQVLPRPGDSVRPRDRYRPTARPARL